MKKPGRKQSSAFNTPEKGKVETGGESPVPLLLLQICFFLSGAAGLIDQVVWTKMLGQVFGYSAYAAATVLAVFMGGLALGSLLFARWRPANKRGIALYAWLEFGIAITAALSLPGIALIRQIYFATYWHAGGSWFLLLALRFIGAALVLALPTILMGATFPVLIAGIARNPSELGIRTGRFYAINTAGAVAGALAAGFFLVPWIGLRATLITAVLLNAIAGAIGYNIARRSPPASELDRDVTEKNASIAAPKNEWLYLICFAAVGATAIVYELSWTRMLATPLGSSTYAFSLMLATFLCGLALGSAIFESWFRKKRQLSANVFAATQLAIAAAVLFSLWTYRGIPEILWRLLRSFGPDFSSLLLAQTLTCAVALLPITILFGFNFPAVLALLSKRTGESDHAGFSTGIGRGVAANTTGAIVAAVLGGFVLLPLIGSFRLAALAGCLNILAAITLFLVASRRVWKQLLISSALLAAVAWTAWSPTFFGQATAAFGVVLYGNYHNSALTVREMADTEDVIFFKDGINASIAVTRAENYVALKTNGKVDASNLDENTQLLLGDLGAVFHASPSRILIIGFGGGMTASAVSRFPEVERIDCVEIEPGVVEAAKHLERLHRGVLSDPRLHIYFDDARNFLQTSRDQYDLIISEPSNPWIAGIAALYTDEFFAVVRSHLAPGGNFVQWIQAYGMKLGEFAMILGGIERQFPEISLWKSAGRDFLVLGRTSTEPLSFDRSRKLWSNGLLRGDFTALHLTRPESWPAYYRLGKAEIQRLTDGAHRNTDDQTLLEYSAPVQLRSEALTEELERTLSGYELSPLPAGISAIDKEPSAVASAETSLEISSGRASKFLGQIAETRRDVEIRILDARSKISAKKFVEASSELESCTKEVANQFNSEYWLAFAQRGAELRSQAESTLDSLLANEPTHELALELKVDLASERKDWQTAAEVQARLAGLRPRQATAQCELGDLHLRANDRAPAIAPLRRGLELDPYAFLCHRDLGELERAAGKTADAINELRWVVRYFPESDPRVYVSLALAYQAAGKRADAQAALDKGKRIFPSDQLLQKFSLRN